MPWLPYLLRNYTSAGASGMCVCALATAQTLNAGNRSGCKYSCLCCILDVALRSKWCQTIRQSVTSSLMTDWMQPSSLSASYNHCWRSASHVFAAFLWWVLPWGNYLKGASSMFSLFMVSSVRSVYPNVEDVNPIASRMFAAVLKRP